MPIDRREFLVNSLWAGALAMLPSRHYAQPAFVRSSPAGIDPWLEVSARDLQDNIRKVSALAGNRPVMAVVKNNAYGLGLETTASVFEHSQAVKGFAAVKAEACLDLRKAGVTKPILHMGFASPEESEELVRHNIQISAYTDDAASRLRALAMKFGRKIPVHLYLDTGMSRMGISFRQAGDWLSKLPQDAIEIVGSYMAFTEVADFDPVQLERFMQFVAECRKRGIDPGILHAASSNGVYHLPDAHLNMVRPGIALYGAYPSYPEKEEAIQPLTCAFSLKAGVVRVARLEAGDTVSYGRHYKAEKTTWVATIPVGHSDGYPREAVKGARILINGQLYPVIGAVSASHCIVELGDARSAEVADVATLIGPEPAAIRPNQIASVTGVSVYDVLMHMNPSLPRKVV